LPDPRLSERPGYLVATALRITPATLAEPSAVVVSHDHHDRSGLDAFAAYPDHAVKWS
jgi:L-ascorbate metabolism protein UlaG (beta-lactamase superfamily)